jgi:hypothetical protein
MRPPPSPDQLELFPVKLLDELQAPMTAKWEDDARQWREFVGKHGGQ